MSLINKMLKELDRRHAGPSASGDDSEMPSILQQLRPVKSAGLGSDVFWWILAFMMLAMVSWLGWVMWQMTPKSIVSDRALLAAGRPASSTPSAGSAAQTPPAAPAPPTVAASAPAPAAVQPTPPAAEPASQPPGQPGPVAAQPPAPAVATLQPKAPAAAARIDTLRLAPEIATPIKARRAKPADANRDSAKDAREMAALVQRGGKTTQPNTGRSSAAGEPSRRAPADISASAPATPRSPARPVAPLPEPRIERQNSGDPVVVAETLYRRAVGFINQGRVSEGIEGLRGALGANARHEAARQTLVALLLEQKRSEEAAAFLQQGLELNPSNAGFAMLLARIMVEQQDIPGALALLQRHAAAATAYADYRAFTAALLQRVARHKEAADEYQAALSLSPQTGVWWVGLGISQEVLGNKKDALESFQRARTTRNLSTDVAAYAEQRARLLQ